MKKFLSIILTVVLLLPFAPSGIFDFGVKAATSGYYTYTTSNSQAKITDVSDSISGAITIPSTLGGYPVVEIDFQAFKDCINVVSVVVPDSVITIDMFAFAGCTGLTDITIGSGVTSISPSAFSGCANLSGIWVNESNTAYSNDEKGVLFNKDKTTIISAPKTIQCYNIPHGVIRIGYSAFSGCTNLASISLTDSLLSIGSSAFSDCNNISSITIPESVVSIDDSAFSGCSQLASISIPSKVTFIGEGVFKGCANLSGIWVDANNPIYCNDTQGVLYNKNKTTIIQAPGKIQSYTVPYGVTEIFDSAFEDCTALTNVTLSSSVLCIGPFAFNGCTNLKYNTYSNCRYLGTSSNSYFALIEEATTLTSCTIHYNTKIIADYAIFSYYLTSVTIPSGVIRIGSNAFSSAKNLKSVSIPSSVISFGSDMFSSLSDNLSYTTYGSGKYLGNSSNPYLVLIGTTSTSITSFSIHKNTKAIANEAFQYCNSLTGVTIPEGVTSIGDWAFYSCDKLSNVTIPDTVTEVGTLAFSDCGSLSSITIPDSVVRIGDHAFSDCGNLTGIWIEESNPSFCSDEKGVLFNKNKTLLIQAPGEISGSYCIPNGVVNIGDSAFDGCYNLSSITIPDSVVKIGSGAFSYCYYIKNVWYMDSQSSREHNLMVDTGNDYLNKATWHYDSCIEKELHTYVDCEDLVCDVCSKSRASSHTYEWVVDQDSNCIYTGIKHEECSVCYVKRNENTIIPVTGIHTFTDANDTECDVCNEAFYQITFNSNGGTTITTMVILPGETTSITTDVPTRNGYVFDGWSLTKNGDADYQPGASISAIDKSMVLYAQWNKICTTCKGDGIEEYSVKCTYCSGKGSVSSNSVCTMCDGDGELKESVSVNCTSCDGTGKGTTVTKCSHCYGRGRKCANCGNASVTIIQGYGSVCSSCYSSSTTKCTWCDGQGSWTSDGCSDCGGDGKVTEYNTKSCYWCAGSGYESIDCSRCVSGYIAKTRSCTACNATGGVIRKSTSAPSAPVVQSYDETVVTLQGILNGEYSVDGINWQESPTFEGLVGGKEYTFYQRYAKTDTTLRSSASVGLTITTQHVYDNDCDTTCNGCGYVRTVSNHVYDNACDATCNVCGVIREVPHFYDMACDTTCNECGATRTVPHLYDDESDPICNLCGHNRAKTSGKTGSCDWYVIDTTLYITGNGAMDSYSSTGPWGSAITKVVIKEGVTTIGKYAFYNCTKLTSVTILESVKTIGTQAFDCCDNLKSITIGKGVTSIGDFAFGYDADGVIEGFKVIGYVGSVAEEYADENGFIFVPIDETKVPGCDYYLDETSNTMPNVVAKTTAEDMISKLAIYGITATITDKNGNTLDNSAKVGTGCKVTDQNGDTYTVIVKGDIDGTGVINSTDYLQIKKAFLEEITLENEYLTAADTNEDGKINSTDYLQIKNYFLGQFDLYA